MSDERRAWSDFPGHVVVRVANGEYGFDLSNAEKLARDLRHAIEEAKMSYEQKLTRLTGAGMIVLELPNARRLIDGRMEIDCATAEKLAHDLRHAIEESKQTPFKRWWNSLPVSNYPGNRLLIFSVGSLPITRDEGEKLFNEIREAR